jgi:hypothetical protein
MNPQLQARHDMMINILILLMIMIEVASAWAFVDVTPVDMAASVRRVFIDILSLMH